MPTYYLNEAAFALPERAFVDRTVHLLESTGGDLPSPAQSAPESPTSAAAPLTVTIRRTRLAEGKTLRQMVDADIEETKASAASFTILEQGEASVAGAPTLVLRVRWRDGETVHHQRQAHVAIDGTWIALAVTGPLAHRAACDDAFDRIVQSLKWRTD